MIQHKKTNDNNWKHGLLVVILAISLLLSSGLAIPLQAQSSVTPDKIEVTLQPGACTTETVTVTTDAAPISKLDLALVIDVTSSMSGVINEVTNSASTITANTRALVPDTVFALGTLSDYQAGFGGLAFFLTGYGGPGDYPWRLDQDFTADENALQAALNNIELLFGGDGNESYLRALYETQFLSWRDDSRRIVILFGDDLPHDPDPGVDFTLDTDDDLTQSSVIEQLAENDISVITVYTVSSTEPFYQAIADGTGGQAFFLQSTEEIPQQVQQLVESSVSRIRVLTLEPTSAGDGWMTWQPELVRDVVPLDPYSFAVELCVPEGTESGDHTFELDVTGDGAIITQIPVLVHVVGADLAVTQDASPDPVFVEDELTYLLTVSNNGPLPATDITLTDELPVGAELISATPSQGNCSNTDTTVSCELLSLANGADATITLVVKPTQAETALNSATVSANESDPDPSNNTAEQKSTVDPVSDISITHMPSNGVAAGEILTYTLNIANAGPSPASNVIITDELPAETTFHSVSASQGTCQPQGATVTCDLGDLAKDANASINLIIMPETAGTLTNKASVTANEFDPDESNNSAEESSAVNQALPWVPIVLGVLGVLGAGAAAAYFMRRRAQSSKTSSSAAPTGRKSSGPTPRNAKTPAPVPTGKQVTHGRVGSDKPVKRR